MLRISIEEAKEKLSDLTKAVKEGETVVLVDADAEYQLIPMEKEGKRNLFGSMAGQIWMSDDFDEPLEDFKAYI
jgi:antitoxin (DNA-binding transcriptional repressor) of toxin-antitoxin stability system